jgi:ABC-2 type transport system ATP-binding protein
VTAAAIEFRGLVKEYGTVRALDGVDMVVEQGRIFGFLGPNGAGKTTAIRCLVDLIRPSAGEARLLGFDSRRQTLEVRRRTGYLPGDLRLYEHITGRQTLEYFASLRGAPPEQRYLAEIVERLDLDPSREVASYSKGNKQKLGLILALMHRPEVLLLDEPTSGLDPLVQEEVEKILREHAAEGRTVFFSSHVLSEVERLCDRVAFIRDGKIVAVEDLADLKGRSLHIVEVTFAEAVAPELFNLPGVKIVRRDGNIYHLEVKNNIDQVVKAIARYRLLDLRTEQPSIEEVFLAYYQSQPQEQPAAQEGLRAAG